MTDVLDPPVVLSGDGQANTTKSTTSDGILKWLTRPTTDTSGLLHRHFRMIMSSSVVLRDIIRAQLLSPNVFVSLAVQRTLHDARLV